LSKCRGGVELIASGADTGKPRLNGRKQLGGASQRDVLSSIESHYCPVDFWIVGAKPDGMGISGDL